jgi:hypothetical protein
VKFFEGQILTVIFWWMHFENTPKKKPPPVKERVRVKPPSMEIQHGA